MGAVTPETCRVTLQEMSAYCCIELDLLLTLNHDARNHELKKKSKCRWRIIFKLDCIKHVSKALLLIHLAEDREGA